MDLLLSKQKLKNPVKGLPLKLFLLLSLMMMLLLPSHPNRISFFDSRLQKTLQTKHLQANSLVSLISRQLLLSWNRSGRQLPKHVAQLTMNMRPPVLPVFEQKMCRSSCRHRCPLESSSSSIKVPLFHIGSISIPKAILNIMCALLKLA